MTEEGGPAPTGELTPPAGPALPGEPAPLAETAPGERENVPVSLTLPLDQQGLVRTEITTQSVTLQDRARLWLAAFFALIFGITALGTLAALIFSPKDYATYKDFLELILPAQTALLGSAVGYYYGTQQQR